MRSRSTTLLLALALVACQNGGGGGGGPGPVAQADAAQTFANFYCDLLTSCNCDTQITDAQCVDESTVEFQTALDEGLAAGLIYNADCMGTYLGYVQELGCKTVSELVDDSTLVELGTSLYDCKVLSGTGNIGDPCTSSYDTILADSCMQGLICVNSVCTELTPEGPIAKQLGEICDPQTEICVAGSVCTSSLADPMTYTCVDLPSVGQSCMQTYYCEEGSWCDSTDFTCKAPLGAGETCEPFGNQCQAALFCDETGLTCVPRLAAGEACGDDDECTEGLECEASDAGPEVCVPEQPLVCGG
jgi:hypothetical protein